MMKPKKRLVKAKLKEDRFVIITAKAEVWFEEHRRPALYAVVALLLVAVAGIAIGWSKSAAEKSAAFAELMTRDAYARSDFDSALVNADAILEDYSGTTSAAIALMVKGRVFESRGQFDEAEKAFQELIDDYSDREYLAFGAYYALGTIAMGKSDYEPAAQYYEKAAAKHPQHFSAPVALVEAGKALEKARRYPQAKQIYRQVLSHYPKSRSADAARDNLAKLEFMP